MLRDDLLLRVKNQVSNHESIEDIDSLIDTAVAEAESIIKNKDVSDAIKLDVAYFRFLLFVRQTEISELDYRMYEQNLSFIKKAEIIQEVSEDEEPKSSFVRVEQRRIFS